MPSKRCGESGSNTIMRVSKALLGVPIKNCRHQHSASLPPYDVEARSSRKKNTTWTGYVRRVGADEIPA